MGLLVGTGPGLLSNIVFRITFLERVRMATTLGDVIERMGGRKALLERFASGRLELSDEERRLVEEALPPGMRQGLLRHSIEDGKAIASQIMDEGFPVAMPYASVLPFLVRCQLGRQAPDHRAMVDEACTSTVEGFCDEDEALLKRFLDEWIAGNDVEKDEKAPLVASVLAHATHGRLHDYLPSLFLVSVTSRKTTRLDGEPEATSLQDLLDPVFLESHAGFMQSQGFPALARRSRDLAALVREGTAPRTRPK